MDCHTSCYKLLQVLPGAGPLRFWPLLLLLLLLLGVGPGLEPPAAKQGVEDGAADVDPPGDPEDFPPALQRALPTTEEETRTEQAGLITNGIKYIYYS